MTFDLVGTAEINQRHGIHRERVRRLLARGKFPRPLAELSCGMIFDGTAVKSAVDRLRSAGEL